MIKRRKMVRAFTGEPLAPGISDRLLRAANRAPSAGFSQGYSFLVLEGAAQTAPLWELYDEDASHAGPREAEERAESHWPVPYWDIDTGFTALLILLAVVDEGLGAVFFGIPPEMMPGFRARFGVPDQWTPIGAIAIGHPNPGAEPVPPGRASARKSLDELVHRVRW